MKCGIRRVSHCVLLIFSRSFSVLYFLPKTLLTHGSFPTSSISRSPRFLLSAQMLMCAPPLPGVVARSRADARARDAIGAGGGGQWHRDAQAAVQGQHDGACVCVWVGVWVQILVCVYFCLWWIIAVTQYTTTAFLWDLVSLDSYELFVSLSC